MVAVIERGRKAARLRRWVLPRAAARKSGLCPPAYLPANKIYRYRPLVLDDICKGRAERRDRAIGCRYRRQCTRISIGMSKDIASGGSNTTVALSVLCGLCGLR